MASERARVGCYADIYYTSRSALIALLRSDLDTAVVQAELSVRLTDEAGVPLLISGNQAALAFILMEARQDDKLGLQIAELRNRAAVTRSSHIEAWCSCLEAQLALRDGNDALFADSFSKAVHVCKKTGLRHLTFRRTTLARLCARALELSIETDFVKELIGLNRLVLEEPGAASDSWPYPLKVYTLGRFELLVDDKLVTFSGRVQQKPLALLKVLIAFGGNGVPEEKITDALWPDTDGDVAHQSFETTLHRLRKMINDKAVVLRVGQVSLDARYCWVDTLAFERILCKSEKAWKREGKDHEDDENPVRLTEKSVSLYKGHYLPADAKQPWSISLRERLRAKFMFSVNRLGGHWMENGRYDKAVQVFLNGLEIDDLAEEFYQHLMVCYHQLGQQTEAVKVYHRCLKVLQSSLGLKPSSKTEGIYYAIRQAK
jgi:DNA-binding SARP family transcriptional activator